MQHLNSQEYFASTQLTGLPIRKKIKAKLVIKKKSSIKLNKHLLLFTPKADKVEYFNLLILTILNHPPKTSAKFNLNIIVTNFKSFHLADIN